MTDETLERGLRAMLAARDPGPAPDRLAVAVEGRIAGAGRGGLVAIWPRLLSGVAAAAVVALLVGVVILVRPSPIGPGASLAPDPTGPYILQPGDGVAIPDTVALFQIVVWAVVLAAIVRAMTRTRDRRLTIALTLAIVGWGWIAANIGTSEALVHQSGASGVMPPSAVQEDEPGTFVGVDGDQPFNVVMTVTNASRLPLELRGLVVSTVPDTHDPPLGPRFVALGTFPTGNIVLNEVQAFRPVTLQSGAMVDLVVLGMAGSCALAAPPADRIGGGFTWLDSVNLVYEQLTIVHSQPVLLSNRVNVWWPDSCS